MICKGVCLDNQYCNKFSIFVHPVFMGPVLDPLAVSQGMVSLTFQYQIRPMYVFM